VDYKNENGQTFRMTVSGQTEAAIEEYLDEVKMCFEAIKAVAPPKVDTREIPLEESLKAAVEEGSLTQEEADELLASIELVKGESDYPDILLKDERTLIVDMEWLYPSRASEEEWVVHYVIDPTIDRCQSRYYRAKCQQAAWARLRAWAGRMSVYFWRYSPYNYIGTRTADAAGESYPHWMYSSSYPDWLTYDLYTRGWQNGSSYSLYGGWWEGFGGEC